MSRARFLRIGLDPRWLLAALSALVVFQFALDSGGSETAVWVGGLFLGLHAAHGDCRIDGFPRWILAVAGLALFILAVSWICSYGLTDTHRSLRLIKFIIVVLGVYCLGRMMSGEALMRAAAAVITLIILWQLAVRHLGASPYGSFDRPHYLAYYALLLVPPILLLSLRLGRPYGCALAVLLLPSLDLIISDLSKPAIPLLASTVAVGVVLFFAAAAWRKWAALLWLALGGTAALYLAPRAAAFFVQDERFTIWEDTARMIAQGTRGSWLLGEGLGSFPEHFPAFSAQEYAYLSLPHNHFLEIFYENGALVLVTVVAALGYLAFRSAKFVWLSGGRPLHDLALCNLAMLMIWFLFSFFAFSFYSSYSLYPLAFIVGIHFSLADALDADPP
jgi:hypothetical protein